MQQTLLLSVPVKEKEVICVAQFFLSPLWACLSGQIGTSVGSFYYYKTDMKDLYIYTWQAQTLCECAQNDISEGPTRSSPNAALMSAITSAYSSSCPCALQRGPCQTAGGQPAPRWLVPASIPGPQRGRQSSWMHQGYRCAASFARGHLGEARGSLSPGSSWLPL